MYNWSVNEKELAKDPEKYAIWKLEQMVNFGLDGGKLNRRELEKYWDKLNLDPHRKNFLELILRQ